MSGKCRKSLKNKEDGGLRSCGRPTACRPRKSNEQEKIPTGKTLILQNSEHNVRRKTNTDFDRNVHMV